MKICIKCENQYQPTTEYFYKRISSPDGFHNTCIQCFKKIVKSNSTNREEEIRNRARGRYWENRTDILKKQAERLLSNKESINERRRERRKKRDDLREVNNRRKIEYQQNRQKNLQCKKKYYENNKEKINRKNATYHRERRNRDEKYKLLINLRRRFCSAMQENYRRGKIIELLGCSIADLKLHLENQFKPGMTWETYGRVGWHIDHIIPCAFFDLSNEEHQGRCFHYTNLQPLWCRDNLSKGSRRYKNAKT